MQEGCECFCLSSEIVCFTSGTSMYGVQLYLPFSITPERILDRFRTFASTPNFLFSQLKPIEGKALTRFLIGEVDHLSFGLPFLSWLGALNSAIRVMLHNLSRRGTEHMSI